MSEPNTPQDDAEPATDGNAPHGTALVQGAAAAPRWLQRLQAPAGVIDTGAAQHSYARHMGWAVQRMSGVGSILARYVASDAAAVGGALPLVRLPIAAGTQGAESQATQSLAAPTVSATAATLPVAAAAVVQRTPAVTPNSTAIARAHPEANAGPLSNPEVWSVSAQSLEAQLPGAAAGLSQRLYRRLAQPGVIKSDAAPAPSPALTLRTGLHQQLLARSVDSSQPALGERRVAAALPLAAPSLTASQLATGPATPVAASLASSAPLTTAAPATASPLTALPSQVLPVSLPMLTLQRTAEPSSMQATPSQPASMPHTTPVEASRAARTADASAAAGTGPAPANAATVMRPVSGPQIARALDAHTAAVARTLPPASLETSTTPLPLAKAAALATLGHATVSPTSAPALSISAPQLSASGATLMQRAAELAPTAGGEALSMPVALRQPSASPVGTSDGSTTMSSAAVGATLMQRAAAPANSADLSGSSLPLADVAHRPAPRPAGNDAAAASVPVVAAAPAPGLAVSEAPALTLQRSSAAGVSSTRTVTPHGEPVAAGQMVWRKTVGSTVATQHQVTKLGSELQVMRSMMEGLQSPVTATPLSTTSGGTASGTGAGTPAAALRAPGVDVQQIAEQVSRILVRDLEIERERRGVKSWI